MCAKPVGWQNAGRSTLSERVYLSLGSNAGDRMASLRFGLEQLKRISDDGWIAISSIYETEPWGVAEQQDFLNLVAGINWAGDAFSLLAETQAIEVTSGRTRKHKKGQPRSLDVDILLFGAHIICSENLTIPHLVLTQRRFVLQPLSEIAAAVIIPTTGLSVEGTLRGCGDECRIARIRERINL